MKVIFIPDHPYISNIIRPNELIESRTTGDDYIESALGVNPKNPTQFQIVPWKKFPSWSYMKITFQFDFFNKSDYYEPLGVPILRHINLVQMTEDVKNFLAFVASDGTYYKGVKFKSGYECHKMNYWFIRYSVHTDIPKQLLELFDNLNIEYEIPRYEIVFTADTETTELLSQLHKDRDYDMVTVSGSLVDNYFCNGPFDLSSVDMLDTEGTYPYAVFLERYQNAWSSIHSGIFTTDEKWYEYILNYYQSHVSE